MKNVWAYLLLCYYKITLLFNWTTDKIYENYRTPASPHNKLVALFIESFTDNLKDLGLIRKYVKI